MVYAVLLIESLMIYYPNLLLITTNFFARFGNGNTYSLNRPLAPFMFLIYLLSHTRTCTKFHRFMAGLRGTFLKGGGDYSLSH